MKIYWISGSAPAWRVLLALHAKGLEYESHVLETSKKQQKQGWFLALNPRGQIPLLQNGDTLVSESLAIMHYLEKLQPDPALFGDNPEQCAAIEQSVHETLSYCDPAITAFVQPVFRGKVDEARHSLDEAAVKIRGELERLEARFRENQWIVGSQLSAADIVLVPTLQRLLRAINKMPGLAEEIGLDGLDRQFPRLVQWNRQIEDLPLFQATFPPHW